MKKLITKNIISYCLFAILSLTVSKQLTAQTTLYYNGSGALNDVANWGINTNGTGGNTGITDFTGNNFSYIIQNTTTILFNTGTWTVSGTGTKVYLGNPLTATPNTPSPAITLTIAAGNTINTAGQLFDVSLPSSGNHKIIYKNTTIISVGTINDSNLELVFDGAVITTTTSRTYGNVSLINGANVDMNAASPVFNNLTVDATSTLAGPLGGTSNWIGIKSGGVVTINGTFRAGRTGSVTVRGGLYSVGVTFPITAATTNGTLLFQDATEPPNIVLGSNSTIDYYRGTTSQTGTQGITPWAYANLTLSNSALASNKSFAITGSGSTTTSVSGTLTVNLLSGATITAATTQNITLKPGARLVINSATAFPAPTSTGKLTLESDANGTASIGTLATGASITGNVTVQQYIPAGFRKYRFLSHPFTTAQALSQLTDNIDITGTGGVTNGFTTTSTNNSSAFFFNTANANGNGINDGGWSPFADATTSSWAKGQGIRVLVRGTKNQAGTLDGTNASPAAVTLDMTGAVNTGSVSIGIVTGGTGATAGFNFVGNPYPSPVDIGAVLTASAANLGSSFYLRNPQTGSYITINPIPPSYIIPANTSFFVQATSATNLNFTEANKNVCATCATVFRTATLTDKVQLKVLFNGAEYDSYTLNMDKNFNNAFNKKEDAIKLMNDGISIYSLSSDLQKLAADYRNTENDSIIPLGIAIPSSFGKLIYTIQVSELSMSAGTKILLHDKLNNTYTELIKDLTISLDIDAANPTSVGDNRLELIYKKQAIGSLINSTNDVIVTATKNQFIVKYENVMALNTAIKISNISGQVVRNINLGNQVSVQENIFNTDLAEGVYLVEVQRGREKTIRKIIK